MWFIYFLYSFSSYIYQNYYMYHLMEQIFISLNDLTINPLNDITTDITTNPNLNLKYNIPNIPKNGYIKFLF